MRKRRLEYSSMLLSDYHKGLSALRNGLYLDFPFTISLETLSLCNAACDFCPYPTLERKGESLPDALIEKILNDMADVKERPPFRVNLSRVNEPFLDRRVLEIASEIDRRFPEAEHLFFSNGTPLDEKKLLALSALRRVAFLNLSVNDHRPEQYEKTMQLRFKTILARLDLIHGMKSSGVLRFPVLLSRVGDGTPADADFLEWVSRSYPLFVGSITARGDWMGAVPGNLGGVPDVGCTQWFKLHLLANGRSAFCCIDSDGSHGQGDAASQHVIHEIYNHPSRRILRVQQFSRLDVAVCRPCTMLS